MDIRDLSTGTELYLLVEANRELISVGDIHAAQSDRKVFWTAIEAPAIFSAQFELLKG